MCWLTTAPHLVGNLVADPAALLVEQHIRSARSLGQVATDRRELVEACHNPIGQSHQDFPDDSAHIARLVFDVRSLHVEGAELFDLEAQALDGMRHRRSAQLIRTDFFLRPHRAGSHVGRP